MKNTKMLGMLTLAAALTAEHNFQPDPNPNYNNSNSDTYDRELAKRKSKRILNTNPNDKRMKEFNYTLSGKKFTVKALNEKNALRKLRTLVRNTDFKEKDISRLIE